MLFIILYICHQNEKYLLYILSYKTIFVCRMKKRSLAGNVALGFYILALVFVFIAFFSTSWLVSDSRITGIHIISF